MTQYLEGTRLAEIKFSADQTPESVVVLEHSEFESIYHEIMRYRMMRNDPPPYQGGVLKDSLRILRAAYLVVVAMGTFLAVVASLIYVARVLYRLTTL